MDKKIKIAVDAMGGENSPEKIFDGIKISLKRNKENYFFLYGKKNILEKRKERMKFCWRVFPWKIFEKK